MLKRSFFCFTVILFSVLSFSFEQRGEKQKPLKTIIIDAGHGLMPNGNYNGAKGSYSYEDVLCLAIAKELVADLKEALPEINIIETRPTENIVPLHRRAEIANQGKGDLFISIHCNAMPAVKHSERIGTKSVTMYSGKGKKRRKVTKRVPQYRYWTTPSPAMGTETYIWGAHKNEDKEVAFRENAAMMEEENYKENYGDVDPNSPEFIALSLLKTKQFFRRSATLSGFVEDAFFKTGRTSRGQQQRQVGIWVLQATAMPSVLIETGYLTNKDEEDYLNSQEGQKEISLSIVDAVKTYIAWLTKNQVSNEPVNSSSNNRKIPAGNENASLKMIAQKENKLPVDKKHAVAFK